MSCAVVLKFNAWTISTVLCGILFIWSFIQQMISENLLYVMLCLRFWVYVKNK